MGVIDIPPPDTRTRGCTASGSRAGPGRASTAPSERSRAGRRPERPGPPSAAATSSLQETHRKSQHQCVIYLPLNVKPGFPLKVPRTYFRSSVNQISANIDRIILTMTEKSEGYQTFFLHMDHFICTLHTLSFAILSDIVNLLYLVFL